MTSNRQPSAPDLPTLTPPLTEADLLDAATLAPPPLPSLTVPQRAAHALDDVAGSTLDDEEEPDTIRAPPPDTLGGEELVEFDHD